MTDQLEAQLSPCDCPGMCMNLMAAVLVEGKLYAPRQVLQGI